MRYNGATDNDKIKLHFGEVIRIYRKREGFTQEELAKLIGVSAVTLGNYEKGKSMPDVEKALKLYKILRIPEEIIFGEPNLDDSLVLYCPEGDFRLDREGNPLCKTAQIISPLFRIYNCRRFEFSCLETDGKIYLLYNAVEFEENSRLLVQFEEDAPFVIADFDGKTYTDIKNGNKAIKISAIVASVLGEITEYEKIE